ncbi:MAG: phosphoribosyltransferase [Nitrospinae bacterium]|nr:phosphoribosyltransferase [Nitrospinota bacterium]
MQPVFRDREEAGEKLAERLAGYEEGEVIVLAIPRGGVPVAYQIVKRLKVPLDLILLRKLPIPWEPEAGFGAIAADGTWVLNQSMVKQLGLTDAQIERIAARVLEEVERRRDKYLQGREPLEIQDRMVILVDDGLATGYTMIAAIEVARKKGARKVIVATPVSPLSTYHRVASRADELVCLMITEASPFAVASFYQSFPDMTDDEVLEYLKPTCPS